MNRICRLLAALSLYAVPGSPFACATAQPVPIAGTERITLPGEAVGHQYTLDIALPPSFAATKTEPAYPLIVVLDGQWNFALVDHVADSLNYDGLIPEAVVVGITYDLPYGDLLERRTTDFLPGAPELPALDLDGETGHADRFLAWIENELLPFLAENYRGDPANASLLGQSYGGLFVLYALLERPTLFRNWVAAHPVGNPPARWQQVDPSVHFTAAALPAAFPDATLHLSVAGLESDALPFAAGFADLLKRPAIEGLEVRFQVVDDQKHVSMKAVAFTSALRRARFD